MSLGKRKINLLTFSLVVITVISVILLADGWKQKLLAAPAPLPQSYEELVEGAKKEGKLMIWTTLQGEELKVFDEFKKKYPFIKIENLLLRAEECREKLLMEAEAGRKPTVDIFDSGPMHLPLLKKKGLLLSFPWAKIFKIDPKTIDQDNMAVATHGSMEVIGYNTKLLAPDKLPKSYEDLLKPELREKLLLDIRGFLWDKLVASGAWTEEKGIDFAKKILDQKPKFGKGQTNISQLLVAGMVPLAVTATNKIISLKRQGAPVEWVPLDPVAGDLSGYSITKEAPHPHSAILLLAWLASADGQKMLEKYAGRSLPFPGLGTEDSRMLEGKKLALVDWDEKKQEKLMKIGTEIMKLWGAK